MLKALINQAFQLKHHCKDSNLLEFKTKEKNVQSNLSYVTFQGNSEIWSHKTGGHLIQV